jgi:protein TonB
MIEAKKSNRADLEAGRLQAFLLGTIVVLAAIFVALEYNYSDEDYDEADIEALDDLLRDVELAPLRMPEEMVALVPSEKHEAPTRLNIVDDTHDTSQPEDDELEHEPSEEEEMMTATDEAPVEALATDADDEAPLAPEEVEQLPQFPGGATAFMKWLTRNLTYPQTAQAQKIQGRVTAQFIVDVDGSVRDIRIVQSLNPVCDREALRVLRMMPPWKPGQQHDRPCRTMVAVPIVFKL